MTVRRSLTVLAATLLVGALSMLTAPSALAATFVVTRFDDPPPGTCDPNDCSLREAVLAANASVGIPDTIQLAAGTYTLSIVGTGENGAMTGDLDVTNDPLTILGAGRDVTIINGGGPTVNEAAFHIFSEVALVGVTITGSSANTAGGILVDAVPATLRMVDARVSGNTATSVAGIASLGSIFLTDTIIDGNTATGSLAGIYHASAGTYGLLRVTLHGNASAGDLAGALLGGGPGTVADSTVSNNQAAGQVAGLYLVSTTASVSNVTISGNRAGDCCAGLVTNVGSISINNSTFTANLANSDNSGAGDVGSGLIAAGGSPTVSNTISAGNAVGAGTTPPNGTDCYGNITSAGYNLFGETAGCTIAGDTTGNQLGANPLLSPLTDNGGATLTHALLKGSPAINAGNPATPGSGGGACAATDQRGLPRNCDIGAYELTFCRKVAVNRIGTSGNETLTGTSGPDAFLAFGGKDTLRGKGGKDGLCGGPGKDLLKGGGGKDRLDGGPGKDKCVGGPGKDKAKACEETKSIP